MPPRSRTTIEEPEKPDVSNAIDSVRLRVEGLRKNAAFIAGVVAEHGQTEGFREGLEYLKLTADVAAALKIAGGAK